MSQNPKYKPRSKEKYPALNAKRAVKNRQDQLEVPYLNQLNDKEKAFLNAFLEETVIANFNHKGKKLIKSKSGKRKIYNENNARNRCSYNKAKSVGQLDYGDKYTESHMASNKPPTADEVEDAMITRIEMRRKGEID